MTGFNTSEKANMLINCVELSSLDTLRMLFIMCAIISYGLGVFFYFIH